MKQLKHKNTYLKKPEYRFNHLLIFPMLVFCLLSMPISFASNAVSLHTSIIFEKIKTEGDTELYSSPFSMSNDKLKKAFKQIEGSEIGLTDGFKYTIRDYTDPFWIGRGTASGDYNKDGWQDILFGTDTGFKLYKNIGGRFELQQKQKQKRKIDSDTDIDNLSIYSVAFVDMNNDGWPDIFFSTFNQGNYLVLNVAGEYDYSNLISVPNQNAVLTLSPSFADLDGNGYLDILNGNIALGVITGMNHVKARRNNSIVFSENLKFRDTLLETTSGETMATLISDLNNDGIPDLYMGNDFIAPDKILLGSGSGYVQVTGNKFIPYTPFFSMGADTGDINNDLTLDFIITGTMYMAPFVGKQMIDGKSVAEYSEFKGGPNSCSSIKDKKFREHCFSIRNTDYIESLDTVSKQNAHENSVASCQKIKSSIEKDICLTQIMWKLVTGTSDDNVENCEIMFSADKKLREVCELLKLKGKRFERRDLYGAIPQDDRNMLYSFNAATHSFSPVTEFKHPGGWTWNSKIVDLDNDGWQDVITSDGTVRKNDYGWNVLMKNIDGKRFEQQQFSAGVTSDFGLYSFVLIDMDNDGDLDIIGNSAEGPVQVYRNNSTKKNNSIAISLIDHKGNYNAVGARITVQYHNHSKSQLREIKASGGYMSFDPMVAYFGLGDETTIDKINVQWPDRTQTSYSGVFKVGQHYRIERLAHDVVEWHSSH